MFATSAPAVGAPTPVIFLLLLIVIVSALVIVNPSAVVVIVAAFKFMLSTLNAPSVPIVVNPVALVTELASVVADNTSVPPILYDLPVTMSMCSDEVHALVAFFQVKLLSSPVTLTSIPASSTPASFSNVLSLVIASSICLSSTLNVDTSILALAPSTIKLPVTRISPVTSNVCNGVAWNIPMRFSDASICNASITCDPAAELVTLIM